VIRKTRQIRKIKRIMNENKIEVGFHEPVLDNYIELVYSIAAQHGIEILIVGGAPREIFLHRKPKDLDFLVVKGDARKIPMQLHELHGFFYPVLFDKFGTYRTGMQGVKEVDMEFIPLRAETIEGDLFLRDFTVNTLTMRRLSLFQYEIRDMLGNAFTALEQMILKTPIAPEKTIKDDPLRIMRAVRFSCTLGMVLDPSLKAAAKNLVRLLNDVAVERVRDELFMILVSDIPSRGLLLMQELGIIDVVMPEVLPMIGFDQRSPYHKDELFTHSLEVMDKSHPRIETRLAALFHDTGKPFSMQQAEGKVTYYGHQDKSADFFKSFSGRLKLPNHIANTTEALIKRHMINYTPEWKDSTIRKFIKHNYDILDQLLALYRADSGSLADPSKPLSMVEELVSRINHQQIEQISRLESPLDGNEIQKLLDIPPGPKIGEIKKAVVDAILEGTIEPTKPSAEAFIKQMYTASKSS
jgi:tRNA nucleotidyltransferase/poly(A) polymerase